jgi:hypothetical protein
MTEARPPEGRPSDDEEFDRSLGDPLIRGWFNEHLPELRRAAFGHRILYQSLAIAFVVGLAAQIGGYVMKTATSDVLALVGDLLYALGWSLWTGVVVVIFVQVIPEVKRRQIKQALGAYEAAQHDGQARSAEDSEGSSTDHGA